MPRRVFLGEVKASKRILAAYLSAPWSPCVAAQAFADPKGVVEHVPRGWRPLRLSIRFFNDLFKRLSVPTDANLVLHEEKLDALYPELLSTKAIPCDCRSIQCDSVFWFRTVLATSQVQYLGRLNNANIASPGKGVDPARFTFKRKTKTLFLLNIINVTEEDTGIYSCVLTDRKGAEVWKSGILLLPGGL